MANCIVHSGTAAVEKIGGMAVCQACKDQIDAARKKVDKHVSPKDCFVWYEGGKSGWQPIPGTGCAHWVSHQRGIKRGGKNEQCMLGHTFRVKTMVGALGKAVDPGEVKVDDVYVTPSKDHTGIVVKVVHDAKKPDHPVITIRHCSSRQGRVSDNDFATYFKGKGSFHR